MSSPLRGFSSEGNDTKSGSYIFANTDICVRWDEYEVFMIDGPKGVGKEGIVVTHTGIKTGLVQLISEANASEQGLVAEAQCSAQVALLSVTPKAMTKDKYMPLHVTVFSLPNLLDFGRPFNSTSQISLLCVGSGIRKRRFLRFLLFW